MTVNPILANTARAAHDIGLAAWLGGSMFGKFAHNPSLRKIASRTERGAVTNAAWNGYNPVNALGLGAAAVGWYASRATETRPDKLTGRERTLSKAKDVLMGVALVAGAVSGVEGARLAKQAPEGAVAVETGTVPAVDTPAKAAKIQRVIGGASNVSIATGVALVAVNGVLAQTAHSAPAKRRALTRGMQGGSEPTPLWLAPIVAAVIAAGDQLRRATQH